MAVAVAGQHCKANHETISSFIHACRGKEIERDREANEWLRCGCRSLSVGWKVSVALSLDLFLCSGSSSRPLPLPLAPAACSLQRLPLSLACVPLAVHSLPSTDHLPRYLRRRWSSANSASHYWSCSDPLSPIMLFDGHLILGYLIGAHHIASYRIASHRGATAAAADRLTLRFLDSSCSQVPPRGLSREEHAVPCAAVAAAAAVVARCVRVAARVHDVTASPLTRPPTRPQRMAARPLACRRASACCSGSGGGSCRCRRSSG